MARDYGKVGRWLEAVTILEPTLKLGESMIGPDHPGTLSIRNNLADAFEALCRWADAEALRRTTLDRRRRTERPISPSLAGDLAGLGANLMRQARWSDAEPILRESLSICEKAMPDDWRRIGVMSQHGGALLELRRYSEAESRILAGYEGLKVHEAGFPAAGRSALSAASLRVVRLYESWNRAEQADAWKRKLALTDLPSGVFAPAPKGRTREARQDQSDADRRVVTDLQRVAASETCPYRIVLASRRSAFVDSSRIFFASALSGSRASTDSASAIARACAPLRLWTRALKRSRVMIVRRFARH